MVRQISGVTSGLWDPCPDQKVETTWSNTEQIILRLSPTARCHHQIRPQASLQDMREEVLLQELVV